MLLLWCAMGFAALAQVPQSTAVAPPDFSGKWTIDKSRTNIRSNLSNITDHLLTIEHREPEIRFSTHYKRKNKDVNSELVYYTDGRPGIDPRVAIGDPPPKTMWQDNKLVRILTTAPKGPFRVQAETREEWVMSADRETLTRITTSSLRDTVLSTRTVFLRVH